MLRKGKKDTKPKSILEEEQMQSPFRTIIQHLCENKVAMGSAIIFIVSSDVLYSANLDEAGPELPGSDAEEYRTGIFFPECSEGTEK